MGLRRHLAFETNASRTRSGEQSAAFDDVKMKLYVGVEVARCRLELQAGCRRRLRKCFFANFGLRRHVLRSPKGEGLLQLVLVATRWISVAFFSR